MTRHHEHLVADQQLPTGVDWLVVRDISGDQHLFVRESLCGGGDCTACPVRAAALATVA